MRSKSFMSRLIVGILIAAMSITSVPISVYAEKSVDVESVAEETPSDTETKMSEETAGEERFRKQKRIRRQSVKMEIQTRVLRIL